MVTSRKKYSVFILKYWLDEDNIPSACDQVPEVICCEISGGIQTSHQGQSIALGAPELHLAVLVAGDEDARVVPGGSLVALPALYGPLPPTCYMYTLHCDAQLTL